MAQTHNSEEIAVIDGQVLSLQRSPKETLEEAQKAAVALKGIIASKEHKVVFNGEQYLEFEDWQTVGRFYGITAKVERTEYVTYGNISGFSARAVAIRADGMEISAAEGECLNDEDKWSHRAKYEWRPKSDGNGNERIHVGDEPVPLFQLKSMAQTRACSKALRNVLAWVVVLAGYRATPAEELQATEVKNETASTSPHAATPPAAKVDADAPIRIIQVRASDADKKPSWIKVEDGREGSTFDKKLVEKAKTYQESGEQVLVKFEVSEKNGRKFTNVTAIEKPGPVVQVAEAPAVGEADKEPVGQPEKVLTVKEKTGARGGVYWDVGTDRRDYVTTDKALAQYAESFLNAAKEYKSSDPECPKVIVVFKVTKAAKKNFNEITEIKTAPLAGDADRATPKQEEEAAAFS